LGQSAHDPDSPRGGPSFATSRGTSKLQQTIVMASTFDSINSTFSDGLSSYFRLPVELLRHNFSYVASRTWRQALQVNHQLRRLRSHPLQFLFSRDVPQ